MSAGQPRLLCVDDEPKVLEGLENNLGWHYDVRLATGGAEGLEMLRRDGPFAVVISDMQMPGMDGATFLAKVHEETPDTTRLLLTGHADINAAIAAVNKGKIFRFLTKPCAPDVLLPAVEAAVEQYQLVRLLAERTDELAQRNAELQLLNDKLAEASVTDSLTGLRNRRFVDQFIASEISMFERRLSQHRNEIDFGHSCDSAQLLFFIMLDLDGFKQINDTYGHHAGDLALVGVRDRLLECCRESDSVVRWGGDEFMIFGYAKGCPGIKVFVERIRESIAEPDYELGENNCGRLSASIGVMPIPFDQDGVAIGTWEQVVDIADQAAYLAKTNGRNAWVSIVGADSLTRDDLARVSHELPVLVSEGKLKIDSSCEGDIKLDVNSQQTVAPVAKRA